MDEIVTFIFFSLKIVKGICVYKVFTENYMLIKRKRLFFFIFLKGKGIILFFKLQGKKLFVEPHHVFVVTFLTALFRVLFAVPLFYLYQPINNS